MHDQTRGATDPTPLRVGLHGEVKIRMAKPKANAQVTELRLVQDGVHVLQAQSRDSKRFEFAKFDLGAADVVRGAASFHEIPTPHEVCASHAAVDACESLRQSHVRQRGLVADE